MSKRKTNTYLTNANLIPEIQKSKEQGRMTEKLGEMLMLLVSRYAKHPWYNGYTYNDEMQSEAILQLCKTWHHFDPERSKNAFGFYTQCLKHKFQEIKNKEKHQRNIRDALIVDSGALPSYTYQEEHRSFDEDDFLSFQDEMEKIKSITKDEIEIDNIQSMDEE